MLPSGVVREWDANDVWIRSHLIAYQNIREYEESQVVQEIIKTMYRCAGAKI